MYVCMYVGWFRATYSIDILEIIMMMITVVTIKTIILLIKMIKMMMIVLIMMLTKRREIGREWEITFFLLVFLPTFPTITPIYLQPLLTTLFSSSLPT